jgi:hypothetical protein
MIVLVTPDPRALGIRRLKQGRFQYLDVNTRCFEQNQGRTDKHYNNATQKSVRKNKKEASETKLTKCNKQIQKRCKKKVRVESTLTEEKDTEAYPYDTDRERQSLERTE